MIKINQKESKLIALVLALLMAVSVFVGILPAVFADEPAGHWEYIEYRWNQNYGTDQATMLTIKNRNGATIDRADSRITTNMEVVSMNWSKFRYYSWGTYYDGDSYVWSEINGMAAPDTSQARYYKEYLKVNVLVANGKLVFDFSGIADTFYGPDPGSVYYKSVMQEIDVTVTLRYWVVDSAESTPDPDPEAPKVITINYDPNEGTVISGSTSVLADVGTAFSSVTKPTVAREGFTFAGWSYSATNYNAVNIVPTANVTLYAFWVADGDINPAEPQDVTIAYDVNGGELKSGDLTQVILSNTRYKVSDLILPIVEKEGFNLKGWSTLSNEYKVIDSGAGFELVSNITLYAFWEKKPENNTGTVTETDGATEIVYTVDKVEIVNYTQVINGNTTGFSHENKVRSNSTIDVQIGHLRAYDAEGNVYEYSPTKDLYTVDVAISRTEYGVTLLLTATNGAEIKKIDIVIYTATIKTPQSTKLQVINNINNDVDKSVALSAVEDIWNTINYRHIANEKTGVKPADYAFVREIKPGITISKKVYTQLLYEDGSIDIKAFATVLSAYGIDLFKLNGYALSDIDTDMKLFIDTVTENIWGTKITFSKIVFAGKGEKFNLIYITPEKMQEQEATFAQAAGGSILIDSVTNPNNPNYTENPSSFRVWLDSTLDIQTFGDLFDFSGNWLLRVGTWLLIAVCIVILIPIIKFIVWIIRKIVAGIRRLVGR